MTSRFSRNIRTLRFLLSVFSLVTIFYFFLTRIPRSWRSVFFEEALYTHIHEIKADWPRRMFSGFILIAFWLFLYYAGKKRMKNISAFSGPSSLECILGCLGVGAALYLALTLISSAFVDSASSIWILWIPYLIFLFYRRPDRNFTTPKRAGILGALVVFLFLMKVTTQFFYSSLLKPTGTWDEATMWWPSLQYFSHHGFHQYLLGFSNRGYDPGHLLLSSSALAPVIGSSWIFSSSNFTAYFFGLFTFALLMERGANSKHPAAGMLLLFLLYSLMVSSHGGWISVLQWRPGNSDSIAALVCTVFFLLIAQHRKNKIDLISGVSVFGAGFLLSVIKPPLSSLSVSVVIGFTAWTILFDRARIRRNQLSVLGIALAGSLLAKILWSAVKQKYSIQSYYEMDFAKLLQPKWNSQAALVVSLLHTTYRIQFFTFLLFGFLAFVRKKQRYLIPYFLVSLSFIGSIIWLYLTLWPTTEHESAGRYFTHTLLAWVWLYGILEMKFLLSAFRLGKYNLVLLWNRVRRNKDAAS